MAAVSAAMFRPGGGHDPSCYATQRIYDSPENTRPKKWSSKLKLNTTGSIKTSENSPDSPYMYGTVSGPGGSALSKSMKYAETWLYGSVRNPSPGIRPSVFPSYPDVAGPVLISTPQKPTPHNYAVILCSCPEYLNGTKKTSSTKVSICKKCKGSRLPLTIAESPRLLVGGTVRGPHINRDSGLLRAGTVRVQGSKSRPTILKTNNEADPYDLMRRSRLATPHEARIGSQFSTTRSRAKSISPCRIKNKKPSPETVRKSRSRSSSRVNEIWVEEDTNVGEFKKSILSCDINPYDLVKSSGKLKSLAEIEFEDAFGDVFQQSIQNKKGVGQNSSKVDINVKEISGQRVRVSDESKPSPITEVSAYDLVNYDLNNYDLKSYGKSSGVSLPDIKTENKKSSVNKNTSKKIVNTTTTNRAKYKSISPKRPPRRIRNNKTDDDSESDNQRLTEKGQRKNFDISRNLRNKNNSNDTIKSILKKPRNFDLNDSSTKAETSDDSFEIKRNNSSVFYLPKSKGKGSISTNNILQRKRVQFLVENDETKVIYTAELNLEQNIIRESPEESQDNLNTSVDSLAETNIISLKLDPFPKKNDEEMDDQTSYGDLGIYEDVQMNNDCLKNIPDEHKVIEELIDGRVNTRIEQETMVLKEDNNIPKIPILRRSESERLTSSVIVDPPKFLDTMALRPKSKHGHTSQVFLTTSIETDVSNQNKYIINQKMSDQGDEPITNGNIIEEGDLSDSSEITKNILSDLRRGISESPEPPPRQKSKERTKSKKHNYVKTRFVRNNSSSSTSDEWSDANDYEQKTILRVKQFDSDSDDGQNTASGVMRSSEIEPRKTSIQINGSECYSTMNVSNNTPIYLSSVVVNDDSSNTCNTYQTGTTVTISVGSSQQQVKKSKSQIYIGAVFSPDNENNNEANTYEEYNTDNHKYNIIDCVKENKSFQASPSQHNPIDAIKSNLVQHVFDKEYQDDNNTDHDKQCIKEQAKENETENNFVTKLFTDPFFGHLAEGLDSHLVKKLIENSLIKLQETKNLKDSDTKQITIEKLIENSIKTLKEEANKIVDKKSDHLLTGNQAQNEESKRDSAVDSSVSQENDDMSCSAPYESMEYESGNIGVFSDLEPMSDCYNASASELSTEDDTNSTRSKFYQMLVDAALCEIEIANNTDDDHHYESIRLNTDPIYEEISDMPPPLPMNPPPNSLLIVDDEKRSGSRSIFEGASKYDILSYLVDAKERGIDDEETYITGYVSTDTSESLSKTQVKSSNPKLIDTRHSSNTSQLSNSDSSEENSLIINHETLEKAVVCKKPSAEIERNDSGVGSETSKSSRSRLQGKISPGSMIGDKDAPIHLCEDCDTTVETQVTEQGSVFAPLVCRKCAKKRAERKEIITEIVETEEKYGRDLQIILEEFYKPMLVAGLLTHEQLSAIFLNVEELIENNQVLSEKLRDGLEIAMEQGDEDFLTVNVGKILLECSGMLTAFQSYCVKQAGAALLLAGLEKEKELLRIFLRVSQMENTVLRRMNLNSFLMVPVQRVTKYPLLLSRLHRATAGCATERDDVRAAQRCVESRLEEINAAAAAAAAAARDVPLWRRLAATRRTAHDLHVADIRLRKMAVDVLDWNHDDARFAMEGKLLFTQPNDNNWRKGRTIKLTPINALLVTNGKPTTMQKTNEIRETREARDREAREKEGETLFARSGVREAALLLVREKAGRYTLQREPLFLDRCVVAADHEPEHFFEVHEITTKDSYIFKAEENARTRSWYKQLQYHAQGAGAWRKRRNALANIMINPMLTRN